MSKVKLLASLIVAGGVALGGAALSAADQPGKAPAPTAAAPAAAQPAKKDDKSAAHSGAPKIGDTAPAFTLTDTDGKSVKLDDFKGKIVVLEWFNPECPFIVKHHKLNKTFNDLNSQYSSKGVVFLAINSSAKGKQGYGKELNAKMKSEYGMQYPILLDEDGKVGMQYGAKNTPQVFIIDASGKLAYMGAIDNNPSAEKAGDKNYAKMALDEMLAGKKVTEAETKAYGCSVKYAGK